MYAADAVEEKLQPHHVGPTRLAAQRERGDALGIDLRHHVQDVAPGLRRLDTNLVQHLLVVVEDDRLYRLGGHRVDLAVDGGGAERRGEQPALHVGVLVEPAGEVVDLAGLHVAPQSTAAPTPDDRRGLSGADRGLDFRLVRVVGELGVGDLALAARRVVRLDRALTNALLRLCGQEPVGRGARSAARAGGASAATGGARLARRGTAACRDTGQDRHAESGQTEEVAAGHTIRFHPDLRPRASRACRGRWVMGR